MLYSMQPLRLIPRTLLSLCLLTSLPGCVRLMVPPSEYLKDCTVHYLTADKPTNADVLQLAVDREQDVRMCNTDKKALRAYYQALRTECGAGCKLVESK